ncbi:hypothetical protein BJ912DRAFT_1031865 [Pholiota molesta]|nr:hypothetical protein BJ912DRAFT_1031865 [Pholiota molesta]
MPPLPRELPQGKSENPHVVQNPGNDAKRAKELIYVRILGYLLHHVPSEEGLHQAVTDILSCRTDENLLELGLMYFDGYIRPFRANKGRTPIPSEDASHPSFDTIAAMMNDTLDTGPPSHTTAKKKALFRDGHRCVVTKGYDIPSLIAIRELRDRLSSDPPDTKSGNSFTECAHIFAESNNADIEPRSDKQGNAATIWDIMMRFGYGTLPEDLNGSKLHRLENVMTLINLHESFDKLYIWFVKAENKDNTYTLESAYPRFYPHLPQSVTFTTPDPRDYPVPSPTYLAIHAACAKIAHLSGAGEYIDQLCCDMEAGTTLNPDGSSAEVLEHALLLVR